jgi:protein-S-isoprenylcysteine O-methyltransferase Ste14
MDDMLIKLVSVLVFIGLSAVTLIVSWRSLGNPRSHGFYRFFTWEFIAALAAMNLRYWFMDPWSWHQWISWLLLFCSFLPLGFGVFELKKRGKALQKRDREPELLAFEQTSQLVTNGVYRYIRHPMYSSLLVLTWGIFFKALHWPGLVLSVLATICLVLTAKADEAECVHFFGQEYCAYMKTTKRFIPFIF